MLILRLTVLALGTLLTACSTERPCVFATECELAEICLDGTCQPAPVVTRDAGRDAATDPLRDVPVRDSPSADTVDGGCIGVDCPGIPEHLWSQTFGGPEGFHTVRALAVDSTGDVVLIGKISSTTMLGGAILSSRGLGDVLVAKYSPEGVFRWAQSFGSSDEDSGRGIAVDAEDNIYVTGHYRGPNVTIGTTALPHDAGDDRNLFVASFQPDGTHRWSRGYPGLEINVGNAILVHGNDVIVVGIFQGEFRSILGLLTSAGGRDVLVLRMDRGGALIGQRRYGSTGDDHSLSSELEPGTGNIVLTGSFAGTTEFGVLGNHTAVGVRDLFVLRLEPGGTETGIFTLGGIGASITSDGIAVGADGIYITGEFGGTVDFGSGIATADAGDAFIMGLGSDLTYGWSHVFGGTGPDRGRELDLSSDNQLLVAGLVTGNLRVADTDLVGPDQPNILLASYAAADGAPNWALSLGSAEHDEAWDAMVTGDTVHICGWVRGEADLGGELVNGTLGRSAAMAAYRIR